MQTSKSQQAAFVALAFLSAFASSSPVVPTPRGDGALADNHVRSMEERGIPVVDSRIPLRLHSDHLDARFANQHTKRQSGGPFHTITNGAQYAIDVKVGTETLQLLFDTGSSSFWVPAADFVCVDNDGKQQTQSSCGFPRYGPKDFSGGQIADQNFNVTYSGGEFATGIVGQETVSFGGVTVEKQKMSFVKRTHWLSAGNLTSGLWGWGLGSTSAIYQGSDPSQNGDKKALFVKPWLETAYEQGLIKKPVFSVVLGKRGKNEVDLQATGYLTIGGAPPASSLPLTGVDASTPILKETFQHFQLENEYVHYAFRPDGVVLNGKFIAWAPGTDSGTHYGDSQEIFSILDTGTAFTRFPKAHVDAIAAAFNPPAFFSEGDGSFEVLCNATAPSVAMRINGKDFPFAKSDVLVDGTLGVVDEQKNTCMMGFQYSPTPPWGGALPYLIGANFYRNVLVVHDLGNKMLTFSALKWE